MEWKENTKDFDRVLKNLQTLISREIKIGFFDTTYDDNNENLYVAQVAQWQEEGHKEGVNFAPPRPFFRQGFHNGIMAPAYKAPLGKLLANVASGHLTPTAALKSLGDGLKFELEASIDNGEAYAPNSPAWQDHKQKIYGITSPLTYTGLMKESVKYKITRKGSGDE